MNPYDDKLNKLIERGEKISKKFEDEANRIRNYIKGNPNIEEVMSSLLESFDGVKEAVDELIGELRTSRTNIGKKLDLLENSMFEQCLVVLSRAIGLWYRFRSIYSEKNEHMVRDNLKLLSEWVGDCIRWSREAIPPVRPLHNLLMEVLATFADNLQQSLIFEEIQRAKAIRESRVS